MRIFNLIIWQVSKGHSNLELAVDMNNFHMQLCKPNLGINSNSENS